MLTATKINQAPELQGKLRMRQMGGGFTLTVKKNRTNPGLLPDSFRYVFVPKWGNTSHFEFRRMQNGYAVYAETYAIHPKADKPERRNWETTTGDMEMWVIHKGSKQC
jgi:hypothetical protein